MNQEKQDQWIKSYLLGDLPPHEREQVEARYFADPDFLERMDVIEAELIEDYALGALGVEKAQKVKQHMLNSPYQLEKLQFAEMLMERFDQVETVQDVAVEAALRRENWVANLRGFFSQRRWPSFVIPAAAAVLIIGGLIFEISRMRRQLDNLRLAGLKQQETIAQQQKQIEQMTGKPQPSPEERRNDLVKDQTSPPPTMKLATFLLLSVTTREVNEKPPDVLIPTGAAEVRLQLVYNGKRYSSYQPMLENADGDVLLPPKSGLKTVRVGNQSIVNFDVPTKNLIENRTYIVRLKAKRASNYEEVGLYDFIVRKQ